MNKAKGQGTRGPNNRRPRRMRRQYTRTMAELAKMAVEGSMAHAERIEADGVYRLLILGGRGPFFS